MGVFSESAQWDFSIGNLSDLVASIGNFDAYLFIDESPSDDAVVDHFLWIRFRFSAKSKSKIKLEEGSAIKFYHAGDGWNWLPVTDAHKFDWRDIDRSMPVEFMSGVKIISRLAKPKIDAMHYMERYPNLVEIIPQLKFLLKNIGKLDVDMVNCDNGLKFIKEVIRVEDMSAKGHLRIMRDSDGDYIVAANGCEDGKIVACKAVEFCTSAGGSRSPYTKEGLNVLMLAMALDNECRPNPVMGDDHES